MVVHGLLRIQIMVQSGGHQRTQMVIPKVSRSRHRGGGKWINLTFNQLSTDSCRAIFFGWPLFPKIFPKKVPTNEINTSKKLQGQPWKLPPLHATSDHEQWASSTAACTYQQLEIVIWVCAWVLTGWSFAEDPRTGILFSPCLPPSLPSPFAPSLPLTDGRMQIVVGD